ncbi:hypothetical protein CP10139811_1299, partial [Chlamydia ibidis]
MHFLFEKPPFMRKSRFLFANPPFKRKTRFLFTNAPFKQKSLLFSSGIFHLTRKSRVFFSE